MLAEKNPYKYRKNRKNNICIVNSDYYVKFSTCRTRCTNSYKIWKPYARTNILKCFFGIGTLMSGIPYRKMSLKHSLLATLRGVCITSSLGILHRTRFFFVLYSFLDVLYCPYSLYLLILHY